MPQNNNGKTQKSTTMNYIVTPQQIIEAATEINGAKEMMDQYSSKDLQGFAQATAENLAIEWPEDEGFGSSDFYFTVASFLRDLCSFVPGFKVSRETGFLQVIAEQSPMQKAMIARIKLLKMNRDNAPDQEAWGMWNGKLEDAMRTYRVVTA